MTEELELAAPQPPAPAEKEKKTPILIGDRGVELRSVEELYRFCVAVSKSRLSPKGFETPEAIMVAVQSGLEVGLTPMAALQNICVINGKPALYGDAALALVRASGLLEDISETIDRDEKNEPVGAVCITRRKGQATSRTTVFTVADAKRAGLWGKSGPWSQYPERMLMFRARGFNLRDNFGDVLKGFKTAEEVADYPQEKPAKGREIPAPEVIFE